MSMSKVAVKASRGRRRSGTVAALAVVWISAISACGSSPAGPTSSAARTDANPFTGRADALEVGCNVYAQQCGQCHGVRGAGDGIHAAHLQPRPSALAGESTLAKADDALYMRIWEGGAMPPFNSAMPAYKTILTRDQVWQTLVYIRTLSSPTARVCTAPDGTSGGTHADGGTGGGGSMSMASAGMVASSVAGMSAVAAGRDGAAGMSTTAGSGGTGGRAAAAGGGAGGAMASAGSGASGGSGAAGAGGAASSGASQACRNWCGCLETQCKSVRGNPFRDMAACLSECTSVRAAELSCWTDQCREVMSAQPALKEHHCEHAFGTHGLEEC